MENKWLIGKLLQLNCYARKHRLFYMLYIKDLPLQKVNLFELDQKLTDSAVLLMNAQDS